MSTLLFSRESSSSSSSQNNPFQVYQPFNIAVLMAFYSPIIVAIGIVAMSFAFQSPKGFIFLVCILVMAIFRNVLLGMFQSDLIQPKKNDICTVIQFSQYGNTTFTMFFIAFSAVYICSPMFFNNQINYWIFAGFIFYYILDVGIRSKLSCVTRFTEVFFNTLLGAVAGFIPVAIMYMSNNQKYLFFNETASTKDICSMPTKQTFKCSVYKNGELIGSTVSPTP
jgi:small-conductance mechanosensitive channel